MGKNSNRNNGHVRPADTPQTKTYEGQSSPTDESTSSEDSDPTNLSATQPNIVDDNDISNVDETN